MLMVGTPGTVSSSLSLSTFLIDKSRVPEVEAADARELGGGKLKDRGVLRGVFGKDPPASKLKSALDTDKFLSFSVSAALFSIRFLNLSSST